MAESGEPGEIAGPRLAAVARALRERGPVVVRSYHYRDEHEDGTGEFGILWVTDGIPDLDKGDRVVIRFSGADDEWEISLPGGSARRLPGPTPAEEVADVAADALPLAGAAPYGEVLRDVPDWVALLMGGTVTAVVIPFVQALAGRTAEEAYAVLRRLLRRTGDGEPSVVAGEPPVEAAPAAVTDDPATDDPATDSTYIGIDDPDAELRLIVPDPIPPEAVRRLVAMDRSELRRCTLVWDANEQDWLRWQRT